MSATDLSELRVAGERVDLLFEALQQHELTPAPNGMTSVRATLDPELTGPFMRALMRIEADLLRAEAELFAAEGRNLAEMRTPGQRRADAFVELCQRLTAAAHTRSSAG